MTDVDVAKLEQQLQAAQRLLSIKQAHDHLMPFLKLMMPDADATEDPNATIYEETPQARLLCEIIEKMERGELKRVAISIGPQLGKSQITSRGGPAWLSGRKPVRNIMLGAYNQDFASEFGDEVRELVQLPIYHSVFPTHQLRKGGQATDLLITTQRGKLAFVGVGGSGSGKPADFFIVDDPIRNDEDAQSETHRNKIWNWFNKVVFARTHGKSGIIVVHTRWHQDDLIGRLCDPDHPERNKQYKGISDRWTYINLPAVVQDPKLAKALGLHLDPPTDPNVISMFGSDPMCALWENRKPLDFLAEAKELDSHTFTSLYMGQPAPEDGDFFKSDWFVEHHDPDEYPDRTEVNFYGASDHGVSTKQDRDPTVIGVAGVDRKDDLWVWPDLVWERMQTDKTVEELLAKFKEYNPLLWWLEDELISKSFGPFLYKRMHETKTYTTIDPVSVHKTDKKIRARSIQGRLAMKKVHFPAWTSWWADARKELLLFPYGTHDDFVDFLSHLGQGLLKEYGMANQSDSEDNVEQTGSIGWIMRKAQERARKEKRTANLAGW